jgi:arylsulfatase A-like enzyme
MKPSLLSKALSNGTATALWHFALATLVLAEDLALYAAPAGAGRLAALPLLLAQTMAVSLVAWLVVGLAWERPWLRRLSLLGAAALVLLVIVDQLTVKLFLAHLKLSLAEGAMPDVRRLLGSAAAEVDRYLVFDLVAAAVLFLVLHSSRVHGALGRRSAALGRPPVALVALALLAAWMVAAHALAPRYDPLGLRTHVVVSLVESAASQPPSGPPPACAEADERAPDLEGSPPPPELGPVRARLRGAGRPNIVLIVLESVGALQLLDHDGLPREDVAPRLRALASGGVVFDTVYGNFPATTRTHVPLITGGRTLTFGGVFEELSRKWQGPALPRALANLGYRTALLSAQGLAFENLDGFYQQQGFDLLIDPDDPPEPALKPLSSDAWGISERLLLPLARAFANRDAAAAAPRPFFLQLLTSSTHHPYVAPDVTGTMPTHDRYLRAIAESDSVVGALLGGLRDDGLAENTVVAVVGDHGEAFGVLHPGSRVHKSFLFEENIRSFLLLAPLGGAAPAGPGVRARQVVTIGDVAPTLAAIARGEGAPPAEGFAGEDLLSPAWQPRSQFFYTLSDPPLWGVRDGRWKYVAQQGGERPTLYDLLADPDEQRDLSAARPERLADAECRCRRWYLRAEQEFRKRLGAFPDGGTVDAGAMPTLADLAKPPPGPRTLRLEAGSAPLGKVLDPATAPDSIEAEVKWEPDPDSRSALLELVAPDGGVTEVEFEMDARAEESRTAVALPKPLAPGRWSVVLRGDSEGAVLLSQTFEVASASSTGQ